MESNKYILQQEYRKLAELGDRLAKADQQIDWEAFRPLVKSLYDNQRPIVDSYQQWLFSAWCRSTAFLRAMCSWDSTRASPVNFLDPKI